jgi:hypothetical protein
MRNESQRHRRSPKSPATSSTQPHSAVTHAEDPGERMKTSNRWRVGHHLARADCHAQSRHAAVDPNHPGSDAPKIAFARCPARPCCVGFRESARRWVPDASNSLRSGANASDNRGRLLQAPTPHADAPATGPKRRSRTDASGEHHARSRAAHRPSPPAGDSTVPPGRP